MKVLVTGHTGFKGSWLVVLLKQLGYEVSGFSLPPVKGGLYELAQIEALVDYSHFGDIRNRLEFQAVLNRVKPEVLIHMAAQPLVIDSYKDPFGTFATNVLGTQNVLEAFSASDSCHTALVVTTDKVYLDQGTGSYDESAPLGGHDPYSASKAMADILAQSLGRVVSGKRVLVARAGNVVGAFDVSENRLLPDIYRAIRSGREVTIRNPESVRPWQHVLDCLGGYLLFAFSDLPSSTTLNFGPDPRDFHRVSEVVEFAKKLYPQLEIARDDSAAYHETSFLTLESSRAKQLLGWRYVYDFQTAISTTLSPEVTEAQPFSFAQVTEFLQSSGLGERLNP